MRPSDRVKPAPPEFRSLRKRYLRRRRIALAAGALWIAVLLAVITTGQAVTRAGDAVIFGTWLIVAATTFTVWRCPRCGENFGRRLHVSRCPHCFLSLED